MSLSKHFNPEEVEEKWYKHWMEKNYFHSEPDEREAFTIVIPPPNVTGILHMGHILNNTIQDILIRKARMEGKNACWVPGTDHASIATEAKVVKALREKGIKKSDLSREEFLGHAWNWTDKYGGIILNQLKKLGASCDWERTSFTLDEVRSEAVTKVFIDLHKKGYLYRDYRMVNWDPEAKTVLSNEEVLYSEEQSNLYHVQYFLEGSDSESVTIATTRPETILADAAIAVHPKDERYTHLVGKSVIVPMVNRVIPIIFDDYVEMEFGTGALKVTPAHDLNDYEIGKRHGLEVIEILDDGGKMNEKAQFFIGEDRAVARKMIAKALKASGHLVETEPYKNNVGRSERTNSVVEPKLSLQWYVDMQKIAKPALDAVMTDDIEFFPKNMKNTYNHWMSNVRDWCISRQLWWGHRIPAYYYGEDIFVADTAEKALEQAKAKTGKVDLTLADLKQDEDALDTWFSSWLWPISVFDGFNDPKTLAYYYPTNVLVTGWDIMFLWVARMAIAGFEWQGEKPFHSVYFTGMVRDKQKRKMSKSLGNSPDALKLIEQYGADGVRYGMLSCSPAGGDLLFDEKLVDQGKNFCNKLWNALKLLKGLEVVETEENADQQKVVDLADQWFTEKFKNTMKAVHHNMDQYRLSDAVVSMYSLAWGDFCSWYLEMVKPAYGKPIAAKNLAQAIDHFEQIVLALHPFMPFITEEIWHKLKDRKEGEDCIVASYPKGGEADEAFVKEVDSSMDVVSKLRDVRNKNGLSPKEALTLKVKKSEATEQLFAIAGVPEMIQKIANIDSIVFVADDKESNVSFMAGVGQYFVQVEKEIDIEAEKAKLESELKRLKGFLIGIDKKLSNERFVQNAPPKVIESERKKQSDAQSKIASIQSSLERLG